ncbi:c-type cytochrome [Cytophagaceae bacterium DM2B3-1]|uniref:C-type cytochrome n=1 Tax=Xanthocytophaga flava TaxID=3048013 RepID=A0ABT7CR48_9BACT|nr:c-type cytochrome [Xanthocytophaga flavus]MDJ1496197.1 c-type cytochrome [Xanthocytophaga flavus]
MFRNYLSLKLLSIALMALMTTACSGDKDTKESDLKQVSTGNPKLDKLKLPDGFRAEHLYSPSENKQGSWVSMTFDSKGRMIASDQYGSLYRLELPPVGDTTKPKVEKLIIGNQPDTIVSMGYAQGLLYAFNSLFVMVNSWGTAGDENKEFDKLSGLYRLEDTDGNDQFDKITLMKQLNGDGEHGPHSIKLSPDGKSLYIVAGNYTNVPEMDAYRLPRNWQEDNIFPLIKDPRGHANDRMAPGGWIAKVDPVTNRWELISAGFRNTYDIAFDDRGELFAYDSDMEWDFGMPWYRPTRILHVTSGSEFGWRTGNSVWSPTYPDNLPAILNIGQGSPTSLEYGRKSHFPEVYQKSLFAFDWSFGIIYAISIKPNGATYNAKGEEFVSGSPLPLTDGVFSPDGSLYFLTGGRRLDSDLYRISYTDAKNKPADNTVVAELNEDTRLRRSLEQYHGKPQPGAVEAAWPNLKHKDRSIRYAARIAIEHQPISEWQQRALNETDAQTVIESMIALARQGKKDTKTAVLEALTRIDYSKLSEQQQVDLLRAFELVFARMGKPEGKIKEEVVKYLNPHYPAQTNTVNRSLSKVLVYIEAPGAVEKTLALLEKAKDDASEKTVSNSSDLILRNPQYGLDIAGMLAKVPPAQQTYLATVLSTAKTGWTPELYEKYFAWFKKAFGYKGGMSYIGFINKARESALASVPKNKFEHYNKLSGGDLVTQSGNELATLVSPKGPGRDWSVEEAKAVIDSGLINRNFENGKNMFAAVLCQSCHAMRGEGGTIGPDLTQLGTRFSTDDMLEHIIDPNKEVSDQYASTVYTLKDGSSVLGRQTNENKSTFFISQNPFAPDVIREIPKKDVVSVKIARSSIMMPGLINRLNPEELKDLLAFLMAGGNKESPVYTKNNQTAQRK